MSPCILRLSCILRLYFPFPLWIHKASFHALSADYFPKRKLYLSRTCAFFLILPKHFYFWHIFVNMVNVCYSPISWPGKAKVCPDSLITHFTDKDVSIWYISVKKLLMISSGRKGWASSNKKAGHPLKHRSGRREDDLFFSFSYFCAAWIKPKLR